MQRINLSIYALKPAFQNVLRPVARVLARSGVRANQITILSCVLCVLTGTLLVLQIRSVAMLLILPPVLLVRMALNALDGMLANEFGQKSDMGAYLNELSDVISDAFLYLPFAFLPPFEPLWIGAVIWVSALAEMTGVLGVLTGAGRRYDGPMGKSDRAFVFGAMALWIGLTGNVIQWMAWLFPRLVLALLALTIVNRIRNGLVKKNRG